MGGWCAANSQAFARRRRLSCAEDPGDVGTLLVSLYTVFFLLDLVGSLKACRQLPAAHFYAGHQRQSEKD